MLLRTCTALSGVAKDEANICAQ